MIDDHITTPIHTTHTGAGITPLGHHEPEPPFDIGHHAGIHHPVPGHPGASHFVPGHPGTLHLGGLSHPGFAGLPDLHSALSVHSADHPHHIGGEQHGMTSPAPSPAHPGDPSIPSFGADWTRWTKDEVNAKLDQYRQEKGYQEGQLRDALDRLERASASGQHVISARADVAVARGKLADATHNYNVWQGRMPR